MSMGWLKHRAKLGNILLYAGFKRLFILQCTLNNFYTCIYNFALEETCFLTKGLLKNHHSRYKTMHKYNNSFQFI